MSWIVLIADRNRGFFVVKKDGYLHHYADHTAEEEVGLPIPLQHSIVTLKGKFGFSIETTENSRPVEFSTSTNYETFFWLTNLKAVSHHMKSQHNRHNNDVAVRVNLSNANIL